MKQLRVALAIAFTAAVLATTPTSARAADDVRIRPAALERGEEARVPHLEHSTRKGKDETIVDGDTRIRVRAKSIWLMGRSLDGYVYATWGSGNHYRIKRVDTDGHVTLLREGGPSLLTLDLSSGDGARFSTTKYDGQRTTLTLYDAADGSEITSRTVRGSATVLDLGDRAVVSSWSPNRTFWWDTESGETELIVRKTGYEADLTADRVAWYTKDPYRGGCSVVAALTDPTQRLWRSCKQRIDEFAPDGARAATIALLADGLGPNQVQLREADGTLLVTYSAAWFGQVMWEDADTLILEANGREEGRLRPVRRHRVRACLGVAQGRALSSPTSPDTTNRDPAPSP